MIEAAPGANECSQCLQIQLNALPARSSLTPFVKLLCSGRVRRDANSLRRPLSRVTPSRGELISIFPAGWAQWLKPSALKQLFPPTRGNLRRDIGKTGASLTFSFAAPLILHARLGGCVGGAASDYFRFHYCARERWFYSWDYDVWRRMMLRGKRIAWRDLIWWSLLLTMNISWFLEGDIMKRIFFLGD